MNRRISILARATLLAVLISAAMIHTAYAQGSAPLPSGHGYLLMRVILPDGEMVSRFEMSQVDSDVSTMMRTDDFELAGPDAWMTLTPIPEGRYYWSQFEPSYKTGTGVDQTFGQERIDRRSQPGSADDTFEIVAGAVNYVGEWTMRKKWATQRRLDPRIEYGVETLQRFLDRYPEIASTHGVYFSMIGKEAISFAEMQKIMQSQ